MKLRATLVAVTLLAVLALLPSVALADSGGATINTLPDSTRLEGHVEVEHQCPRGGSLATCFWFGEAAQYPASVECPAVFDVTHSVWVGSEEESTEATTGSFAFAPEATVIRLCLYVEEEGSSLVGESHPFSTQTGSEPRPQRQATRTTFNVRIYGGCKAHIYAYVNGGEPSEGSWSDASLNGPSKARFLPVSDTQPWTLAVEGPTGTYSLRMHYAGSSHLLPSPAATVRFRLRRCVR